ncbi:MAG: hypothetical protein ACLFV2_00110 [Desulfurivibrionaceae bacterium]
MEIRALVASNGEKITLDITKGCILPLKVLKEKDFTFPVTVRQPVENRAGPGAFVLLNSPRLREQVKMSYFRSGAEKSG